MFRGRRSKKFEERCLESSGRDVEEVLWAQFAEVPGVSCMEDSTSKRTVDVVGGSDFPPNSRTNFESRNRRRARRCRTMIIKNYILIRWAVKWWK